MIKEEKMIRIIEETSLGRYDMTFGELSILLKNYEGKLYDIICAAFKYGFVKGQRSIKNQQKKAGAANV